MTEHVYKTIELTGSSSVGVEGAVRNAIKKAAKSVHKLRWFEVSSIRGHVEGDSFAHWQVTMKLGFSLDD
jgi:flavin-binding protein dodecin